MANIKMTQSERPLFCYQTLIFRLVT